MSQGSCKQALAALVLAQRCDEDGCFSEADILMDVARGIEQEQNRTIRAKYDLRSGRTVEAGLPTWMSRSRVNAPAIAKQFGNYVNEATQKHTANPQTIQSVLEDTSKSFYAPTFAKKRINFQRKIQQEMAENAQKSGEPIGSDWGMGAPANNLKNTRSFQPKSPFFSRKIPILGPIAQQFAARDRKIFTMLSERKPLARGVFQVECKKVMSRDPSSGKVLQFGPPEPVDILDLDTLAAEEISQISPMARSLVNTSNPTLTPSDILNLRDRAVAGQNLGVHAGPNAARWLQASVGPASQELASEARRVGMHNTFENVATGLTAALGVAAIGYSYNTVLPPTPAAMDKALPQNQDTTRITNIGTSSNPGAAFGTTDPAQRKMANGVGMITPTATPDLTQANFGPQESQASPANTYYAPQVDLSSVLPSQVPTLSSYWLPQERGS